VTYPRAEPWTRPGYGEDPDEEPRRLTDWWHEHTHGDHTHRHDHGPYVVGGRHFHQYHSPARTCSGDDTFGFEEGPRLPSGYVGEQLQEIVATDNVFIPYVPGGLKTDTTVLPTSFCIDVSRSQYDYWDLVCLLGEYGHDFAICEQDMAPPPGSIEALLNCPEPWCAHNYQTMQFNHSTGENELVGIVEAHGDIGAMGLCAFKGEAVNWLGLVVRGWGPITWSQLDGMVYRALRVPKPGEMQGFRVHRHYPDAGHLHAYRELAQPAQSEPPVAVPSALNPDGRA
jgi:hypothetical protein